MSLGVMSLPEVSMMENKIISDVAYVHNDHSDWDICDHITGQGCWHHWSSVVEEWVSE